MPQTNPEDRQIFIQKRFNRRHRIFTGGGGIARPLERNTPSGLCFKISSALVLAGTTVTLQPAEARQRKILRLAPKSMATTWNSFPPLPPLPPRSRGGDIYGGRFTPPRKRGGRLLRSRRQGGRLGGRLRH